MDSFNLFVQEVYRVRKCEQGINGFNSETAPNIKYASWKWIERNN